MGDFPESVGAVSAFANENFQCASKHTFVMQKGTMSGARTVSLPPMAQVTPGKMVTVVDVSGSVNKALPLVVQAAPGELINGAANLTLISPYGSVLLITSGDGRWSILALWGVTL